MLTVPVDHKKCSVEDFKQFLKHPVRVRFPLIVKNFIKDFYRIIFKLIRSGKIVKSALNDV